MPLSQKDVLGLRGMPREDLDTILNTAELMKYILKQDNKKTPHLQGKSIVTLFYENSTRTRMSFELASKYMSAVAANMSASASSVQKGETLIDTGVTLDQMGTDVIIIRHPMSGAPHLVAKHVKSSIINAGDGMNEHPTQGLLDIFSMKEKLGKVEGLKVAIIGDILHSRVARSDLFGLTTLGAEVHLAGPATMLPAEDFKKLGAVVHRKVEDAMKDADVVMGLRMQKERQQKGFIPSLREYYDVYGITPERMELAKEHAMVMHPGPMNRGVEIASSVADSDDSVIAEQVTNGVAVRMALLYLLTRRKGEEI